MNNGFCDIPSLFTEISNKLFIFILVIKFIHCPSHFCDSELWFVDHDVGQVHISVNHQQFTVEMVQCLHNRHSYFSQDTFSNCLPLLQNFLIKLIQRRGHHFHADPDISLSEKSSIISDHVEAVDCPHGNIQIHHQSLPLLDIHSDSDSHHSHDHVILHMILHHPVSTSPQFGDAHQVIRLSFKVLFSNGNKNPGIQIPWRCCGTGDCLLTNDIIKIVVFSSLF